MAAPSDTIVAIATAQGPGAVAIVRVSGPAVSRMVEGICGRRLSPRLAQVCRFRNLAGEVVDEGLAVLFAGPASFTGEDVLELQGHGGSVVPLMVQAACLSFHRPDDPVRLALPGEFTQRAFLNDKLDLAQAEAVASLVSAGSLQAAKAALASLGGAFSASVRGLQAGLTDLRMRVEACLDFPEEDIEFVVTEQVAERLKRCQTALSTVLASARRGQVLGRGLRMVLSGPPNVGKSSLLNALSESDVAIVTDVPGTTRDRLVQTIEIEGLVIDVIDTAGLRETEDVVEQLGIERSWRAIGEADLVVLLRDASGRIPVDALQEERVRTAAGEQTPCLVVWNKADLQRADRTLGETLDGGSRGDGVAGEGGDEQDLVWLSAKTGEGLASLRSWILQRAGLQEGSSQGAFGARARQVDALRKASDCLVAAAAHLGAAELELLAEQLRLAQSALFEVTGEFVADDLLGEIFSRFCIGK